MIKVVSAGTLNTIQDLGRKHYRHLGVCTSGALDKPAMILANALLHNTENTPVLELTFGPIELQFSKDTWIAICGAEFNGAIDGQPIWTGSRHKVIEGQKLSFKGAKNGMRGYLAVAGGFHINEELGSTSTDIAAKFGGHYGRPIQNGDLLQYSSDYELVSAMLSRKSGLGDALSISLPTPDTHIRVTLGPEFSQLTPESQQALWQQPWQITASSNRMGARLEGKPLDTTQALSLLSHAVLPGIIQLPPSGKPIILLADAQTTGGYPKIACVIEADLWKLAQVRPNQMITFEQVSFEQATMAMHKWDAYFYQAKYVISQHDAINLPPKERCQSQSKVRTKPSSLGVSNGNEPINAQNMILNADLGEGCEYDDSLLKLIDYANIACGGHIGDQYSMNQTIKLAIRHNVTIGAHPSFPDPDNFGRAHMDISKEALYNSLKEQVCTLATLCHQQRSSITYIKPHGALYNLAAEDKYTADVLIKLVLDLQQLAKQNEQLGVCPQLKLMALANSSIVEWAKAESVDVIQEAFADRRYLASGALVPRSQPGAVIEELEMVLEQVHKLQASTPLMAIDGTYLTVDADSLCLHGDNEHALTFAKAIKSLTT